MCTRWPFRHRLASPRTMSGLPRRKLALRTRAPSSPVIKARPLGYDEGSGALLRRCLIESSVETWQHNGAGRPPFSGRRGSEAPGPSHLRATQLAATGNCCRCRRCAQPPARAAAPLIPFLRSFAFVLSLIYQDSQTLPQFRPMRPLPQVTQANSQANGRVKIYTRAGRISRKRDRKELQKKKK